AVRAARAGEQTVRAQAGEAYGKTVARLHEDAAVTVRLRKGGETNDIEREFERVKNAYEEIGESYNKTIPAYLLSVCGGVMDMALAAGEGEGRKKRWATAQKAIRRIGEGMAERRNLTQYAKAGGLPFVKLEAPAWRGLRGDGAGEKLAALDRRITKEVGKRTFHPAGVLWETARSISKSGKGDADIAAFILASCERMLDNLGNYLV
ncbi:MAG: hypothetical protein NT157_02975, partial [Candidatus Micrarchaeota archaeon]|nr:hypothetical protein [Candidatus Micrarchaeota archaeon]